MCDLTEKDWQRILYYVKNMYKRENFLEHTSTLYHEQRKRIKNHLILKAYPESRINGSTKRTDNSKTRTGITIS